ncbi:protein ZINC INDUCED FACILITATOR-LIKE 1 isoform X2 [Cajanus cajan]|uniref:protein ZINC INDUCED FACILITATOR-LIKE 1 isoform X2 n=1 Tax=Cajanus cajan TaxID=3821 RepID=UPI00098D7EB6|nr:protein ZINC INDUCED FACILITATOR-LIKE 1 isoform X2 [Cajanus cajan]
MDGGIMWHVACGITLSVYFMVKDFNIAETEEDISTYAGYVGSSLMLGRALTSILWGMISDRYGRKPVIIIGIITVVIFNTLFGLSTNFWMAISMRFLLGSLNGLLGPIKAYATEIFREEEQALGLSTVVAAWGVGLVIGPALGGFLAQPVLKYPHLFPKDSFWDRFPYFLPCFIISILALASTIACIWLPVFSLWALSPRRLGGLNFTTDGVGIVLAISGVAILIYQLTLYRSVQKAYGPITLVRITGVLSIPLLQCYPFMTMLSGFTLDLVINIASILKNLMIETIATSLFILQNKAVEQHQRGTANSIAMTGMSAFKTIGPASAGALLSWTEKNINDSFLPGTHVVFLALNFVEGVGVLLMFKPFLSVKEKTQPEQLH